jgi:NADH-ubiquinone oxidoreductase chain 5
MNGL